MKDKTTKAAKILALTEKGGSVKDIAKAVKCDDTYVYYVRWMNKNKKKKPTKLIIQPQYKEAALKLLGAKEADPVNHPPHYKAGGIEVIDFIEAKDLNYRLGNVIKYVSRAGKKDSDPVQDLEKAAWYLKREIDARKGA